MSRYYKPQLPPAVHPRDRIFSAGVCGGRRSGVAFRIIPSIERSQWSVVGALLTASIPSSLSLAVVAVVSIQAPVAGGQRSDRSSTPSPVRFRARSRTA